jgi:Zn-dependent peptidase ImmA (M78 family)
VAYYPFRSSRIADLLIQEEGGSYCIGINSHMVVARQLFSLAHELGHYALHRHLRQTFLCHTGRQERLEREANAYAVQLLMPERELRGLAEQGCEVAAMCAHFGVSESAMVWRLEELGLWCKSRGGGGGKFAVKR